jgi:hypothetical protein
MLENLDLETVRNEIHPNLARVATDDTAIEALLFQAAPDLRPRGPGFWANVREQFRLFLCTDDPRYAEERVAFRRQGRATPTLMGMLTGAIVTGLGGGILISTLAPFVALLVYTAADMTKNVFCEKYRPAAPAPK